MNTASKDACQAIQLQLMIPLRTKIGVGLCGFCCYSFFLFFFLSSNPVTFVGTFSFKG